MGKGVDAVYGLAVVVGGLLRGGRTRGLGVGSGVLLLLPPVPSKLKSLLALALSVATGRQWGTTLDLVPSGLASIVSGLMCYIYATRKKKSSGFPFVSIKNDKEKNYVSNLHDLEAKKGWGYADTEFEQTEKDGHAITLVGSNHYPDIGHKKIPGFIDFVTSMIGISHDDFCKESKGDALVEKFESTDPLSGAPQEALDEAFKGQVDYTEQSRKIHSRGGYYSYCIPTNTRLVDAVVFVESTEDVEKLIEIAREHKLVLIPRGGGTNVSNMLEVPHAEPRKVISVDMTRMDKLLSIDEKNTTAEIEAGANGRLLEEQLNAKGYTMGHEPDSYEFSTLGGWVSTAASGMKRTKYGNIEDIVVDIKIVTTQGRHSKKMTQPRYAHGPDLQQMLIGSEGNFGVITSVVVHVHPLPERQDFDSMVFKTWEEGMGFMRESFLAGCTPAACRLVDNDQFRFGHALKPEKKTAKEKIKSKLQTFVVTKYYGFDPLTMCAATMKYEGSRTEVAQQKAEVTKIAKKYGGVSGGAEGGRTGYNVTMAIAYIGDFLAGHNIIGETFETCAPWDKVTEVRIAAKEAAEKHHKLLDLPGQSFISSRVTQQYRSGVCIYFTFGYYHGGMDGAADGFEHIYFELKKVPTTQLCTERLPFPNIHRVCFCAQAVVAAGGSVSHHHGIGKLRKPFIEVRHLPGSRSSFLDAKRGVRSGRTGRCGTSRPLPASRRSRRASTRTTCLPWRTTSAG